MTSSCRLLKRRRKKKSLSKSTVTVSPRGMISWSGPGLLVGWSPVGLERWGSRSKVTGRPPAPPPTSAASSSCLLTEVTSCAFPFPTFREPRSPFQSCSSPTRSSSYSVAQSRFLESRFSTCSTISCLRKYHQCFIGHFALSFVSHGCGVRQALVTSSNTCSSRSEMGTSESGCWAQVQLCLFTTSGRLCSACFAGFGCGDVCKPLAQDAVVVTRRCGESAGRVVLSLVGVRPWMTREEPSTDLPSESAAWQPD